MIAETAGRLTGKATFEMPLAIRKRLGFARRARGDAAGDAGWDQEGWDFYSRGRQGDRA